MGRRTENEESVSWGKVCRYLVKGRKVYRGRRSPGGFYPLIKVGASNASRLAAFICCVEAHPSIRWSITPSMYVRAYRRAMSMSSPLHPDVRSAPTRMMFVPAIETMWSPSSFRLMVYSTPSRVFWNTGFGLIVYYLG